MCKSLKLAVFVLGLSISSYFVASVAPVSGNLSQYAAEYGSKAMPAWSSSSQVPNMQTPQATLHPEVLNSVAQPATFTQPFIQQKIKPHPAISGRGMGGFRRTGVNLMSATAPRLMSRAEAAQILGVDTNASEEAIKRAYQIAAKKAHPDLGGSHERMQKINEAKDTLLQKEARADVSSYSSQGMSHSQENKDKFSENDNSELLHALENQNIFGVRQAIANGVNPNERYSEKKALDEDGPFYRIVRRSGASALVLAMQNFEANPTRNNFEIIKLLLNSGANPSPYLVFSPIRLGNDEIFDLFVSKNVQLDDTVLNYLKECVFATPHMYEVVLPLHKGKKLSSEFLSDILMNIRLVENRNNLFDRYKIINAFIKNGFQFNLNHLFSTVASENVNFNALKELLSSDLSSKNDDGTEINRLEIYQKLVQQLEELKADIDKPTKFSNRPRRYTLQDLNEVLNLAHNRLKQAKSEDSLMNRINKAFKGGMSSMWGKR